MIITCPRDTEVRVHVFFHPGDGTTFAHKGITYRRQVLNTNTTSLTQRAIWQSLTEAVRDSQCVVFRVVEGQDFMLRLLHQDVEPDGQVGANHVHEAKPGQRAVPGNLHLLHRKNDTSIPCPSVYRVWLFDCAYKDRSTQAIYRGKTRGSLRGIRGISTTDMCRLTTGIRSEKCAVRGDFFVLRTS